MTALAVAATVIPVAIAKLPFLGRAVFGDGQAYMIPNPLWLVQKGFFPLIPKEVHPPLYFLAEAAAYVIWPRSPEVFHTLAFLLGLGSLVAIYFLGRHVFGRREGVTAVLLLAASPLFLAQTGLVRLSVPLLFLSLMALLAAWRSRWKSFALWGSALVLTKFSGLPVVLAGVALAVWRRESRRDAVLSLVPLIVLGAWVVVCRIHYGWFLYPENTADVGLSVQTVLAGLRWWLNTLLFGHGQTLLAAVVLLSLASAWYAGRRVAVPRGSLLLTLAPMALGVMAFSVYRYTFPRYMLPYLAMWFVLCSRLLWAGGRTVAVVGTLLVVASGLVGYLRKDTFGEMAHHESNLSYLPLLSAREEAAAYLESEWFDARILAPPKLGQDLTLPPLGYVSNALPSISSDPAGDLPEVYYRFPVMNRAWPEKAEERLGRGRIELLREFGDPSLGVAVFRVTPKRVTE